MNNNNISLNKPPEKAKLKLANQPRASFIEFQFNPTEIIFDVAADLSTSKGARQTETGAPKVNFSNFQADKVTLKNIVYDTFEVESGDSQKKNVLSAYINKYKEAMKFVPGKDQPPILTFSWGNNIYLKRCFIENLSYRLTMFASDGTPVRAVIDSLTLVETDKSN